MFHNKKTLECKEKKREKKRNKKEKYSADRDPNLRPLSKKSDEIPLLHRDLIVNKLQECVYIAMFVTKVKIRILGYCTIFFRHNKHSNF
jgi:hypothetical protein